MRYNNLLFVNHLSLLRDVYKLISSGEWQLLEQIEWLRTCVRHAMGNLWTHLGRDLGLSRSPCHHFNHCLALEGHVAKLVHLNNVIDRWYLWHFFRSTNLVEFSFSQV
jgi:hypothetical protein